MSIFVCCVSFTAGLHSANKDDGITRICRMQNVVRIAVKSIALSHICHCGGDIFRFTHITIPHAPEMLVHIFKIKQDAMHKYSVEFGSLSNAVLA